MGFDVNMRRKTLQEIIQKEGLPEEWARDEAFRKMIDAKIGLELKNELFNLKTSTADLPIKMEEVVKKLIGSNEKLANANNRYAKALCLLTGGLVLVGLLPYLSSLFASLFKMLFN